MEIHAYSDLYVDDAMTNLGEMLYCGVCLLGYDGRELYRDFSYSDIGRFFSCGNPRYVTGMSGFELLEHLIYDIRREHIDIPRVEDTGFLLSAEYNAGSALAYYQWRSKESFRTLYNRGLDMEVAMSALPGADADLERFAQSIDIILQKEHRTSTLARLRAYWQWSQRELSERSGVSLRSIQLYEQGQNDISHANADVVRRLSTTLGCSMEELISLD